jgi:FtsP/CotA-like multicopper oxidase with cupredoxin domain
MLTFAVDQHLLIINEVDGSLVNPVVTDHLEINSAQRYSVLIKTHKMPINYIINCKMIPGPDQTMELPSCTTRERQIQNT